MIDLIQTLASSLERLEAIGQMTLPAEILAQGVVQVAQLRLSRLRLDDRPMLQLAAVIGREIDFKLLETVDDEMNYDLWLANCADAAILDVADGKWRFTHDKIRYGIL